MRASTVSCSAAVGKSDSGMANVGECLYIASQITPGDRDSWYQPVVGIRRQLVEQADAALAAGHTVSAAWLLPAGVRSTSARRSSGIAMTSTAQSSRPPTPRASRAFHKALPLLDHPGVGAEGRDPRLRVQRRRVTGPFPTILHIGGYDGTAEENFASAVRGAGPGLGIRGPRRPRHGHPSLPAASSPCVPTGRTSCPGWSISSSAQPEVDPDRIVLVGRSFGGLLAPRGASGEPRLAALIVDPGQIDMAEGLPQRLGELWDHVDDPTADDQFEALLQIPALKTLFAPRMTTNGVTTVRAYIGDMRRYTSRDQVAADHLSELHHRQRDR